MGDRLKTTLSRHAGMSSLPAPSRCQGRSLYPPLLVRDPSPGRGQRRLWEGRPGLDGRICVCHAPLCALRKQGNTCILYMFIHHTCNLECAAVIVYAPYCTWNTTYSVRVRVQVHVHACTSLPHLSHTCSNRWSTTKEQVEDTCRGQSCSWEEEDDGTTEDNHNEPPTFDVVGMVEDTSAGINHS